MGRNYSDSEVQTTIKESPYSIIDVADKPIIILGEEDEAGNTSWTPEQISALVLKKLKIMAEIHLNETVRHAVISVPSYFNDQQRQATRDAAAMANLNVLRLINEITAIAIAYDLDTMSCHYNGRDSGNWIIYDSKDSEIDLALLSVDRGVFEILGTARLKNSEVPSKIAQFLFGGSRFDKVLGMIKQLLVDTKMKKEEVDGIVINSDRIDISEPQRMLEAYFQDKKALTQTTCTLGHDEAIVYGAARQGEYLSENSYQDCCVSWMDVSVLSLGIETSNGSLLRVIDRQTVLPMRKTRIVSTITKAQEKVEIKILEGEREVASKNKLLGTLELNRDQWESEGAVEIEITFTLDANDILTASAKVRGGSEVARLIVPVGWKRYTLQEIEIIAEEGETFHDEDLQQIIEFPVNVPNGVDFRG